MKESGQFLDRIAHEVIGAAIEVHRTLGPGFLQSIYIAYSFAEVPEKQDGTGKYLKTI